MKCEESKITYTRGKPAATPRHSRRVVQTANDRQENHRADFEHCPNCGHSMNNKSWQRAAVTLVLNPGCYKAGSVAVMSECPKCFGLSWVHHAMTGFAWDDDWPASWRAAVDAREKAVKLEALRRWGAGICHNCRHLVSGTVDHHAWRECVRGFGPVETACDKHAPL